MAGAMQGDHDAHLIRTWLPDPSHYPEQMTPLSATFWFEAIGLGLHAAMRELRGPFGGFLARTELGWAYEGELEPDWEVDVESVRAAARALGPRWDGEIEPRVIAITAELQRMRPEFPPPPEAVALLDRVWELVREQWTWHFLTVIPAQFAIEMLRERASALSDDPLAAFSLLGGVRTERTDADGMLWELAVRARQLGIDDVLLEYPPSLGLDRLREFHHGRVWLHELDGYLLRFGGRSRWHELSLPREIEEPVMTMQSIRLFLSTSSPSETLTPANDAADRSPLPARKFGELLAVASVGYRLKEDHTYFIDYPGLLATREVLLSFGRRLLAEGRIEAVDDVWMLTRDELRAALPDRDLTSLAGLVQERKRELARGREEGPRPYLGEPPGEIERHTVLDQFYGAAGDSMVNRHLTGIPASRGEVEGTARIVVDPADLQRVQPGDILVTTTTTPAWTPLFPSLGGLVTETGGVLSHAAVVAREYQLVAVVGVEGATRRIPDGARIRVDGTSGQVMVT